MSRQSVIVGTVRLGEVLRSETGWQAFSAYEGDTLHAPERKTRKAAANDLLAVYAVLVGGGLQATCADWLKPFVKER